MGAGRGEKGCGVTASAGEDNGKGCEAVEEGREEGGSDVKRGSAGGKRGEGLRSCGKGDRRGAEWLQGAGKMAGREWEVLRSDGEAAGRECKRVMGPWREGSGKVCKVAGWGRGGGSTRVAELWEGGGKGREGLRVDRTGAGWYRKWSHGMGAGRK